MRTTTITVTIESNDDDDHEEAIDDVVGAAEDARDRLRIDISTEVSG